MQYSGGFRKKADAENEQIRIEARLRAGYTGAGVMPKRILTRGYAEKWKASRTTRPKTQDRDNRLLDVHFLPICGDRVYSGIDNLELAEHIGNVCREVSFWTGTRLLMVLRAMGRDAKAGGYVPENFAAMVKTPTLPTIEYRLASPKQVCELLAAIREDWRLFTATFPLAGLRIGETTALEVLDLDLEHRRLYVRRQQPTQTHDLLAPKYGSFGPVNLLPPLREAFMDWPQRGRLLFPAAQGGYVNYQWYRREIWKPAIKAAKLDLSPKDLRHFFASMLIAFGEDAVYVSRQMRHKAGPSFTYRQYVHLFEDRRRLDREKVLQQFAEVLSPGRAPSVLPQRVESVSRTEEVRA